MLFVLLPSCLASASLAQDVFTFEPRAPQAGQTLEIQYDPSSPGALYAVSDEVHAVIVIHRADLTSSTSRQPMRPRDGDLVTTIRVPDDGALVQVNAISIAVEGRSLVQSGVVRVHGIDGQPVRGAYHLSMSYPFISDRPDELFNRERELHPDNWAVYREKWEYISLFGGDPGIRQDLELLAAKDRQDDPALQYVIADAHRRLGDTEEAMRLTRALFEDDPTSALTHRLIESMGAAAAGSDDESLVSELKQMQRAVMERCPDAQAVRR
jgi:hypothetical protein